MRMVGIKGLPYGGYWRCRCQIWPAKEAAMDTVKHVVYKGEDQRADTYEWKLDDTGDGIVLRYRKVGWEAWHIFVDATTPILYVNMNSLKSNTNAKVVSR